MKSKNNIAIGCIIQARMSSTRLPGKVMLKVDNENTILDCVINQLQNSKEIKNIVIATTDQEEDDVIAEFVKNRAIKYFRGSKKDVLDRYYQCAKKFNFSEIIRITSDNPLIDYEIVDTVVEHFKSNNYDFITTDLPFKASVHILQDTMLKFSHFLRWKMHGRMQNYHLRENMLHLIFIKIKKFLDKQILKIPKIILVLGVRLIQNMI